jgi:hypothetical protein
MKGSTRARARAREEGIERWKETDSVKSFIMMLELLELSQSWRQTVSRKRAWGKRERREGKR